jgi:hypothetical protein
VSRPHTLAKHLQRRRRNVGAETRCLCYVCPIRLTSSRLGRKPLVLTCIIHMCGGYMGANESMLATRTAFLLAASTSPFITHTHTLPCMNQNAPPRSYRTQRLLRLPNAKIDHGQLPACYLFVCLCCLQSILCCLLSAVCCLLSAACCLLSVVYCLRCAVWCLLSILCCKTSCCSLLVFCLSSVVCFLLPAVCRLLSVVCCLLSVLCCLLSVVCCLLSAVCCLLSTGVHYCFDLSMR